MPKQNVIARRVFSGLRYLCRGDLHGLARGVAAVWRGPEEDLNRRDLGKVLSCFQPTPIAAAPLTLETDIIIPVYNGVEYLPQLFDSIIRNTLSSYRLIIIDDCSSDPRIIPLLEELIQQSSNGLLLRNDRNLGFIGSVNRAAEHARENFVLLNTDVQVPSGWLERLMAPLLDDASIASATPFTNAGTICSFPLINRDNNLPIGSTVDQVDSAFRHVNPRSLNIELPTGVGFCMAVSRAAWLKIGGFDPVFGRGYGEENDWCQRAKRAGFVNVLVPNLFVFHSHAGSFEASERQRLLLRNLEILHHRYPRYDRLVREYIKLDPMAGLRDFLKILVARYVSPASILVADHQLGGGANAYRRRFVAQRVEKGESVLLCTPNPRNHTSYNLDCFSCYGDAAFALDSLNQLTEATRYMSIGEVVVNSLVDWPEPMTALTNLKKIKQLTGARMTIPVHDFFSLCPSYNLLNESGEFCNLPAVEDCLRCLPRNPYAHNPEGADIRVWRAQWRELIDETEDVRCFSGSSLSLVQRVHHANSEQVRVCPHDQSISFAKKPRVNFDKDLHIGVVGAINHAKGAAIVSEIAKILEKETDGTTLSVIGPFNGWLRGKYIKVTGPYEAEQLPVILTDLGINICFLPSVWPETFSFVTSEVIDLGLPLCCFDLGAPAERVRRYPKGLVISRIDATYALAEIRRFYESLRCAS